MPASPRSLADALRLFDDARRAALLRARPDLLSPPPASIAALAARAASPLSVRRALRELSTPQLAVLDALNVLPDPAPRGDVADLLGAPEADLAPTIADLATRALLWEEGAALRLVRAVREARPWPGGLAPVGPEDPSAVQARALVADAPASLAPVLESLRFAPGRVRAGADETADATGHGNSSGRSGQPDGGPTRGRSAAEALEAVGLAVLDQPTSEGGASWRIPRSIHLALRGGRLLPHLELSPPPVTGQAAPERFAGARTAGAVEAALDAVRLLRSILQWRDDAPGLLRRGGLPQRDLRRLAKDAGVEAPVLALVLQSAWLASLLSHDGEVWGPSTEWLALADAPDEALWAEIAWTWAAADHLAALAGTADAAGQPRAALSEATARPGAAARRLQLLRLLASAGRGEAVRVSAEELAHALAWWQPLVPPALLQQEAAAVLEEGSTLGLIADGVLTELGRAALAVLDSPEAESTPQAAESQLAAALARLAPPPVEEVLLGADLTIVIPGRPSSRLLALLDWTEIVSRGSGLTLRLTSASVRRALSEGLDADALLDLLRSASRTPLPQALEYLVADEQRRSGQVRVGAAAAWVTGEADALARLLAHPEAGAAGLQQIAPTVVIANRDPRALLRLALRTGLTPHAVDGSGFRAQASAPGPGDRTGGLLTGSLPTDRLLPPLDRDAPARAVGPRDIAPAPGDLAARVVAALRSADEGGAALSPSERLHLAADAGAAVRVGIVDGRGGMEVRELVILGVAEGRVRARDPRTGEELSVLAHRIALDPVP
ncbi:helicase-associated domain-containing protein [Brachybacterium equifaecis]|uniref:helicase-associated domain-containing protein n=1 Tax=Brachybacterium equifaecis TaxID=2910770 RepID=UPI0024BD8AC9|nr:helicase-associated domain-containing protein [Brachybacterium equifaecis]